jgi:RNA polymerase sigma-70 factor, ECF subfamily
MERASRSSGEESLWWLEVFRRTYPGLLAYAGRRVGVADAADAVAEVFLRAFERRESLYRAGMPVDGWLYGVLRNVVREMHRAAVARLRVAIADPAVAEEPDAPLLRTDEVAMLRAAFVRLSAYEQQLLNLRVLQGLSAKEVGARLGKRPGAVRMAQSRALERLREMLADDL